MTTPSTAPYDESVQVAVARETARRKRVLLAFLGLLLVPVAIGAYALSEAPTVKKIATEVTPIVAQSVSSDIAARVTNDVVARTEPLLRESVSREVAGTLEPRITSATSALQRDISALQTTVRQTSTAVAGTQRLSRDVEQLRREVNVGHQLQTRDVIGPQLARIERELAILSARVARLETERRAEPQPTTRPRPRPPGP